MQQGKIPYSVLKRSIWKHTGEHRPCVLRGAGPGCDAAVVSCGAEQAVATAQHTFVWQDVWGLRAAFYRVLGDIAASGGTPECLQLAMVLPEQTEEPQLRELMTEIELLCRAERMEIIGGHTTVSSQVAQPVLTVTMTGFVPVGMQGRKAKAGQELVMSRAVALEGTALLTLRSRARLSQHFPDSFLLGAERFLQELSVAPEAAVAIQHGVRAMHNGAEGGIFGALWEFAEASGLGMEIDRRAIPIRQETVEICEFLNKNPYELASGGMLLMAAENGAELAKALRAEGIPAAVIGQFTDGKARILRNEDEIRYLDRPRPDGIWR